MNRRDFLRSAAMALGAGALFPKVAEAEPCLDSERFVRG